MKFISLHWLHADFWQTSARASVFITWLSDRGGVAAAPCLLIQLAVRLEYVFPVGTCAYNCTKTVWITQQLRSDILPSQPLPFHVLPHAHIFKQIFSLAPYLTASPGADLGPSGLDDVQPWLMDSLILSSQSLTLLTGSSSWIFISVLTHTHTHRHKIQALVPSQGLSLRPTHTHSCTQDRGPGMGK